MGVGIDIGTKSIKLVELDKSGDGWKLVGSGIISHSGELLDVRSSEKSVAVYSDAIKKLHKEAKISSKDVVISMPESQVFTRVLRFPMLTDQEVSSAVKWEAEQYIPIPIEEAIVQHEIMLRDETATPPFVKVLLVASPRNAVEMYVKAVEIAGLNPIIVETELLALLRSLTPEKGVFLLADIGATSTDIAIAKDRILGFSRSIPTGGDAFTRSIAQNLGVGVQQAEQYKRTYGLSKSQLEGKIYSALQPIVRMIADEIKKAIHFYKVEEKGEVPKSIIISGGSAGLIELTSELAELLNMEVIIGNPFSKVAVSEQSKDTILQYAPLYSVAAGLAMRHK